MASDNLEQKGISVENLTEEDFFHIKSIRQYPDPYAFWRHEGISLTLTDDSPDYEKTRPVRFGGEDKQYTLRTDGDQKVKNKPLYNKYDEQGRRWNYSKNKSLTAVKEEGFSPPAFSFNEISSDSVEVGYMLPAKPAYVLPRRILQGQGGTIHRNFRYATEKEAKEAWERGLNKTIFRTLGDLAQHGNCEKFNEVMAHVKWGPQARIAYFKDNLNSKLRAISLAHDMSVRLQAQQIKNKSKEDSKSILPDAKELPHVPIYSYLPKEGNRAAVMEPYKKQEGDIDLGLESKDVKTRAFARFIQLQRNDFVKKKEDEYSAEELEIFIKIAADLMYESSTLFFENFFTKNLAYVLGKMEKSPHLLREIFRCVPLDKRSELIYPLLTKPKIRGYYLHSLLKFDCLEHDTEEFFKQLESGKEIDFKVVGEYKPTNVKWKIVEVQDRNGNTPLHLAAARDKVNAVDLLCKNGASINAQNKEGNTPLHLAASGDKVEAADLLCKKGASINQQNEKGKTPLDLAIEQKKTGMIKFLLEKKGMVCALNRSVNLLQLAVKQGDCDLVEFLLEKNPDLAGRKDNDGLAALHHAISSNNSSILKLLLEKAPKINHQKKPLHYAISNNRLEMMKLLIEKGEEINLKNSLSRTPLNLAVRKDKLVATDLLLGLGGTHGDHIEKVNSLRRAMRKKNGVVIDFLLARGDMSFLSLMAGRDKILMGMSVIFTIVGEAAAVYKNMTPSLSQDFSPLIDMGSIALPVWTLLLLIYALLWYEAIDVYKDAQKRVKDKETMLAYTANTASLRILGVNKPSVAGVLKLFASLSLSEQAEKLIEIAKVDSKLSLYVIIRLFNSKLERASNILWEVSRLSARSRKEFCDLFENLVSDELEVIVGCVTQKIKEEEMDLAVNILNMFSEATKAKILERLDPIHQKPIKEHLTTINDQKRRVNIDSQSYHRPQQSPTGRDTFFYHNDPPLEVKDAKKSSEFVWQLKVTAQSLAERIKMTNAKEVFNYLHDSIERGGLGLDEESANAHLSWVFAKHENEIPPEKQGIMQFDLP